MQLKCKLCGKQIIGRSQKRYCEECVKKRKAESTKQCRERKKQTYQIKGQSSRLSRDVCNAFAAGITYGKYMEKKKEGIL